MKTTIEYRAGHIDVLPDVMPTITEDGNGGFILFTNNADMGVESDDIPLAIIRRVIFEPEETE